MHQHKPLPSDLAEREWALLRPFLPLRPIRGRPRADDRQTLNGILCVLSTGCRWGDVPPERSGAGKTCWQRFAAWQRDGTWDRLFHILLLELNRRRQLDLANAYLDTSIRQNKRGLPMRLATPGSNGKTAYSAAF